MISSINFVSKSTEKKPQKDLIYMTLNIRQASCNYLIFLTKEPANKYVKSQIQPKKEKKENTSFTIKFSPLYSV